MRLLMLTNVVPYPPHGGVHTRVFNLLQRIAGRHEVMLGCHSWGADDRAGAEWLTAHGIRTVTGRVRAADHGHIAPALHAVLAGQPPEVAQYQTPEIHALVAAGGFDVLQVEETLLAPYARSLSPRTAVKTVLTLHNIHFIQEARIAALGSSCGGRLWRRLNAAIMRRYEPVVAARFDRIIAVSAADRKLLVTRQPKLRVDIVPNGVDTRALRPLSPPIGRHSLIFVGTLNYLPNSDGVLWFAAEVWPQLRARFADLEFWIVGKLPPPEVVALGGNGIHVTGYVDDVTPYYARAAVAVVPLRAGGGSRLKILEAMALGRPVVSTTVGAEGLDVTDGATILLADDASSFADAVVRALTEVPLWSTLAVTARQFVEDHHDWEAIADRQLAIYDDLLGS